MTFGPDQDKTIDVNFQNKMEVSDGLYIITRDTNSVACPPNSSIKTKQGKEGKLIVIRCLMDDGNTLMVTFTLRLNAEPDEVSARQIWHKQA